MKNPFPVPVWTAAIGALICILTVIPTFSGAGPEEKSAVFETTIDESDTLTPYADFRFRYEGDWDSLDSAGIPRSDRHRLRIRQRVGIKYQPDDLHTFDVRARTGNSLSQQSPHLTIHDFSGGARDDLDAVLDKYYFQRDDGETMFWAGRNQFPFWKQNELIWDDDVTITGAALKLTPGRLDGTTAGTIGAFFLPDGGWDLNGQMYAGQIRHTRGVAGYQFTTALGLHFLDGSPGASQLRNGNGARDYSILASQFQLAREVRGIPVSIGSDFYVNTKDYSRTGADLFAAAHADEDFGYVLSVNIGELNDPGDFVFAYYYAYIEAFAVNASYAQDDWVRWGSSTQTDSSDLKGHEFRLVYRAAPKLDIMARLYAVNAITSPQDGMRFRVDFNYRF